MTHYIAPNEFKFNRRVINVVVGRMEVWAIISTSDLTKHARKKNA